MKLSERKKEGGRERIKGGGDTCKGLEKGKGEMTQFYLITMNKIILQISTILPI